MDKRAIDNGRARIALHMIGFGLTSGLFVMMVRILSSGQGIRTGPASWGETIAFTVIFLLFWAGILFITGRCLGGIVQGIAEVVRGVNFERPLAPKPEKSEPTNYPRKSTHE